MSATYMTPRNYEPVYSVTAKLTDNCGLICVYLECATTSLGDMQFLKPPP